MVPSTSLFSSNKPPSDPDFTTFKEHTHPVIIEARARLEDLWRAYAPYADRNFRDEIVRQFSQRFWEMYLAVTLFNQGHKLVHKSSEGPDIKILEGAKSVWIEAIAPTIGEGGHAIPPLIADGTTHRVPGRQMRLRLAQAFTKKAQIYRDQYLRKNIVSSGDPLVIAISSNAWGPQRYQSGMHPDMVRVLFGLGNVLVRFNKDNHDTSVGVETEAELPKGNSSVAIDYFRRSEYSFISAVIYSTSDAASLPDKLGADFLYIRNPLAINPLPPMWPRIGTEYTVED